MILLLGCLMSREEYQGLKADLRDEDGDGYLGAEDCDDFDAAVHPGAEERPYDGADNDCDVLTRDDDLDVDGVPGAEDCDDGRADAFPGAAERCNGADDDCDGAVDEGVDIALWVDADGDGWGGAPTRACELAEGLSAQGGDCADADAEVSPAAEEACGDGVDNDCDDDPLDCRLLGSLSTNDLDEPAPFQVADGVAQCSGDLFGFVDYGKTAFTLSVDLELSAWSAPATWARCEGDQLLTVDDKTVKAYTGAPSALDAASPDRTLTFDTLALGADWVDGVACVALARTLECEGKAPVDIEYDVRAMWSLDTNLDEARELLLAYADHSVLIQDPLGTPTTSTMEGLSPTGTLQANLGPDGGPALVLADQDGAGMVRVYPLPFDPDTYVTLLGDGSSEFGASMAAVDVDRDGWEDLAIVAPVRAGRGQVLVWYGPIDADSTASEADLVISPAGVEDQLAIVAPWPDTLAFSVYHDADQNYYLYFLPRSGI